MRIAYISYEHPLSIGTGGIGTYVSQIGKVMAARNHDTEIFCGSLAETPSYIEMNGYRLNLIPCKNKTLFKNAVIVVFAERHSIRRFELIESPEFGADGLEIKKKFPEIPLVVKLHTPSFLVSRLNAYKNGILQKLRFLAGGLIRFERNKPYWVYDQNTDPEFELYQLAESVISPSSSLAKIVRATWRTGKEIKIIPNPFTAYQRAFKALPPEIPPPIIVTFIGKLEKRKGVLDLMKAIPLVLGEFPEVKFYFAGSPSDSPIPGLNMDDYLKKKLKKHLHSLNFLGFLHTEEVFELIDTSHICIFPSLWENFPYACLEAMSAGRGVIGTDNGGMADMISDKVNGLLIPPRSPKSIFRAIRSFVSSPDQLLNLGKRAKTDVAEKYNEEIIGKMTEDVYLQTIRLRQ
jgi:glycosyltransferase involved in cell wall biosynthesis